MDIVKAAERLYEIRQLKKELEKEEKALCDRLREIIRSANGKLIVGGYVLSLTQAETYRYGEILRVIKERHPEIEAEIAELSEKFKTPYSRISVERLS